MALKLVISNPSTRKTHQIELDQSKTYSLLGKKIGEDIDGDFAGLSGYTFKITGGTDKDGFPMHPQVKGTVRKRVVLSSPPGFHPLKKGQRKRKMVRGDTVSDSIAQLNVKVVKSGTKSLDEVAPTKSKKPAETPQPEVKEEPKQEVKEEKKEEPKTEIKKEEIKVEEKKGE
ncbi:MAG: 30S ribosomal protein S6e [Candidatus Aenigmatarchaeota archaeon]